ncbi:MAG TPA: sulfotransferase [Gammaproteobacteria bacterium]|nr:sulfotransferase [Gammaproteobacteria bacterium]
MSLKSLQQAEEYRRCGDLANAAKCYRDYLRETPGDAERWHALAGLEYQRGRIPEAIQTLKKAIALRPTFIGYINDLGRLYFSAGRLVEAESCYRRVVSAMPDMATAHYNLATVLSQQQKTELTIESFERAIALRPDYFEAIFNLGLAYVSLEQFGRAEQCLVTAARLMPQRSEVHNRLAYIYEKQGRHEAAVEALRLAVTHDRKDATLNINLIRMLYRTGRTDEAIAKLRELLAVDPTNVKARISLAKILRDCGDIHAAEQEYLAALERDGNSVDACFDLVLIKKITSADQWLAKKIDQLLAQPGQTDKIRSALHFASGKIHDDLNEYAQAFSHYSEANRIRLKSLPPPPTQEENDGYFHAIQSVFTRGFLQSSQGNPSTRPLFVIGMLRSGTTLVEQILSSHPDIHGAGELEYFHNIANKLDVITGCQEKYPKACCLLSNEHMRKITNHYLELLGKHSLVAKYVVDKMPGNYLYLGLIKMLFPNVRIVNCLRNPLDVCLSNYFQTYDVNEHSYAYDLLAMGRQYLFYEKIMRHWHAVMPGQILDIQYEDVVDNTEVESKRMIHFFGLEWDSRCLAFYARKGNIRTASKWQVRQPIYKHSKERWRNYEPYLHPLKELLIAGGAYKGHIAG